MTRAGSRGRVTSLTPTPRGRELPLPRPLSLVVGGKPATPGQFPYQAGLVVTRRHGQTARCAAALLSDRWLLTAAHCCKKGKSFRVMLGTHTAMQDAKVQVDTTLVLIHPMYSRKRPGHFDIALIRLREPVHFSDDRPARGTAVLRFARERVLATEEASKTLGLQLPPYFLCVRGLHGEVSCNGDSGGPLVVDDSDGLPMLVGIVSHRYGEKCGESKLHVCTRVTSFLPWISSMTRVSVKP